MNFNDMLDNIYTNLELTTSDVLVLPIPVLEKSTTRIIWKNIKEFLKITNTPPEHLFEFIENQTNKKINWFSDSISDGLIIHDKKFSINDIKLLMKKYVNDFIICNSCKKSNTKLFKDSILRKYKIKCNFCNSESTI
jgi:translation initiation factor 2 subunit 2